jgi:hypothetical protein
MTERISAWNWAAWVFAMIWASWAQAQGPSVEVTLDRGEVRRGESIQLAFTFNNCEAEISVPEIEGLKYAFGPSRANNVSIFNGRRSQQLVLTYTYLVQATSDIQVPAYEIKTNKGKLTTEGFRIRVRGSQGGGQASGAEAVLNRDVAMVIDLPKREVFVGEPIVATLQIYTLIANLDVREYKLPEFKGFWKESVDLPNPSFQPRLLNGRRVQVATVGQVVLFPQQTGELVIDGFELTGYIRTSFFNGRNVVAAADPVKLTVKPLPTPLAPRHLGAFKQLDVTLKASDTELTANEAFTVDITFRGNGNLKFLREPEWTWPRDFEVFDPEVKDQIRVDADGEAGSRTFHYVIIPRTTGNFTLPEFTAHWFDTDSKEHREKTVGGATLTVGAGAATASTTRSYNSKSDIQILNQDIRYIQLEARHRFEPLAAGDWRRMGMAAGLVLAPLQFVLLLLVKRKRVREASDVLGTRRKQAKTRIRKELREAHKAIDNPPRFYEAMGRGLEAYLTAKLGWTPSAYTRNGALQAVKAAAPECHAGWQALLEQLDMARFAAHAAPAPKALYETAVELVNQTEKAWNA